jgi:adenylate cyclase
LFVCDRADLNEGPEAAISLRRLQQPPSRKVEVRQMLAEIYGWFTEGFDTADLKEAKALLEELE